MGEASLDVAMPLTQSEIDELAFEVDDSRLEVGTRYRAIGPNVGKLAPPNEVEVVSVLANGYRTTGLRQAAAFIAFGCERFWMPVLELAA